MEIDHILKLRDHENNPNIYVPNLFIWRLKSAYLRRTGINKLYFIPHSGLKPDPNLTLIQIGRLLNPLVIFCKVRETQSPPQ